MFKREFHGTDTDTENVIFTRIVADLSADLSDKRDFPREDVR